MAIYAVGDVQGCAAELEHAARAPSISIRRATASGSSATSSIAGRARSTCCGSSRALGDAAIVVLGNHDLHLLAAGARRRGPARRRRTLRPMLEAPDREPLLDWLQARAGAAPRRRARRHACCTPACRRSGTSPLAQRCAAELERRCAATAAARCSRGCTATSRTSGATTSTAPTACASSPTR